MEPPKGAERVFHGVLFDVYQWKQKMYDGSIEIFEAVKRQNTVQILPTYKGKILLSYEEQPRKPLSYTFFGGRIDKQENPLKAGQRELLEETGLESNDWELFTSYDSGSKIIWNTYFYIARNCVKVAEPNLDKGEKIIIKSFNFKQFLQIVNSNNFRSKQIALDIVKIQIDKKALKSFEEKVFYNKASL